MKKKAEKKFMNEAFKHLTPLKHKEFTCPYCKGIATVNQYGDIVTAECHACSRRERIAL